MGERSPSFKIEYETARSMVEDRKQRKDLRDHAKKYDNTQFKTVNVDRKKVSKKKTVK